MSAQKTGENGERRQSPLGAGLDTLALSAAASENCNKRVFSECFQESSSLREALIENLPTQAAKPFFSLPMPTGEKLRTHFSADSPGKTKIIVITHNSCVYSWKNNYTA